MGIARAHPVIQQDKEVSAYSRILNRFISHLPTNRSSRREQSTSTCLREHLSTCSRVSLAKTFANRGERGVNRLLCSAEDVTHRWLMDQLPLGDSRCREKPPSKELIQECVRDLRATFGEDIHFAKDDGKWSVFFA